MTTRAIPTKYAGRQFRSRLEARWATFFDLVGWRYEYEPFDLRGWIPDFALIGKQQTTLVEVKPVADFNEDVCRRAREKATRAVLASGHKNEILVLGYAWPMNSMGELGLGWLCEWCERDPVWDVAAFHDLGGLGFCHNSFSYRNRITGEYNGAGGAAPPPLEQWAEAGNLTQWRAAS